MNEGTTWSLFSSIKDGLVHAFASCHLKGQHLARATGSFEAMEYCKKGGGYVNSPLTAVVCVHKQCCSCDCNPQPIGVLSSLVDFLIHESL